jgi:long-chain acyl-CoA synthetase
MKDKGYYDEKPWIKSTYEEVYKESLKPYPEIPLFKFLDDSAERFPDELACSYHDREMTYKEFKDHADRFATALSDIGVKKGDRVSIRLPNCPQYSIADYGILKAGGIPVPCSPFLKAHTLTHELATSGAKGIICFDTSLDLVKSVKDDTSLEFIIITSSMDYTPNKPELKEIPGTYQFRDLIEKYEPKPPNIKINPKEDLASLQFTGGTTGLPKGVMLTHFNLTANVIQGLPWMTCELFEQYLGDGAILLVLPFDHAYGHFTMHTAVYMAQNMLLVDDARDFDEYIRLMKKYDPWQILAVPTQIMYLIPKMREEGLEDSRILAVSGSAALHPKYIKEYEELTGVPVIEGYGLSETSPVTHYNLGQMNDFFGFYDDMDESEKPVKYGSIGVPFPDTDVKVVDLETGEEVPQGERGEMYIRGPQLMKGYWPTPGKGITPDGWLPTGDVVKMDKDGYFFIVDRVKDMVNVSGLKVYTEVVDEIIGYHPAVQAVGTIGIPDPERPGSERVKAFIILKDEYKGKVTEEDIINYCKEKMEGYMVPKFVEFRDKLPLSGILKVLKRKLRDEEIAKMKREGILDEEL